MEELGTPLQSAGRRRLLGCLCCGALLPASDRVFGQAAGAGGGGTAGSDGRGGTTPAASSAANGDWRARLLPAERTLWLVRGSEQLRSTYWTPEAGYDGDAYKEICWLLRDVQASKSFAMSPRLLDLLAGLQYWLAYNGVRQPIHVNSGYRTFATNIRTEGSALNSRHVIGRAADITVPGVPLARLAGMASVFGKGGVGMYLAKGFVHVDTGEDRIWVK
jgi:uncharacterized protein YcbK (DUF882 family)